MKRFPNHVEQFIGDVRDMIATLDPTIPPHALTTDEIYAAWLDGMQRRVVAENFAAWYRNNVN